MDTNVNGTSPAIVVTDRVPTAAPTFNKRGVTVVPQAPVITSPLTATFRVGDPFEYQVTATNSPTVFAAVGLPAGLSIDEVTGLISGVPADGAAADVELRASNAYGTGVAILALTLAVGDPPVITSATSLGVTWGETFSYEITATNAPTSFGASGYPATMSFSGAILSGRYYPDVLVVDFGDTVMRNTFPVADWAPGVQTLYRYTAPDATPGWVSYTNVQDQRGLAVGSDLHYCGAGFNTVGDDPDNQLFSVTAQLTNPSDVSSFVPSSFHWINWKRSTPAARVAGVFDAVTNSGWANGGSTIAAQAEVIGGSSPALNVALTATNAAGVGHATLAVGGIDVFRPVITSPLSASMAWGEPFAYQITADNVPTSFGAAGAPIGLVADTVTGLVSGRPLPATLSVDLTGLTLDHTFPEVPTWSPGLVTMAYLGYGLAYPGYHQWEYRVDDGTYVQACIVTFNPTTGHTSIQALTKPSNDPASCWVSWSRSSLNPLGTYLFPSTTSTVIGASVWPASLVVGTTAGATSLTVSATNAQGTDSRTLTLSPAGSVINLRHQPQEPYPRVSLLVGWYPSGLYSIGAVNTGTDHDWDVNAGSPAVPEGWSIQTLGVYDCLIRIPVPVLPSVKTYLAELRGINLSPWGADPNTLGNSAWCDGQAVPASMATPIPLNTSLGPMSWAEATPIGQLWVGPGAVAGIDPPVVGGLSLVANAALDTSTGIVSRLSGSVTGASSGIARLWYTHISPATGIYQEFEITPDGAGNFDLAAFHTDGMNTYTVSVTDGAAVTRTVGSLFVEVTPLEVAVPIVEYRGYLQQLLVQSVVSGYYHPPAITYSAVGSNGNSGSGSVDGSGNVQILISAPTPGATTIDVTATEVT